MTQTDKAIIVKTKHSLLTLKVCHILWGYDIYDIKKLEQIQSFFFMVIQNCKYKTEKVREKTQWIPLQ